MPKKNIFFKRIFWSVGGGCFLSLAAVGTAGVPSGWLSHFFSSAQADQVTFSLHEYDKEDSKLPDPQLTLGSFKKPVMLVLWMAGCVPCVEELLILDKLAPEIRAQGGEVIPVLLGSNWGSAVPFLLRYSQQKWGVSKGWREMFPNLNPYYDSQGQVSQHKPFKIERVPLVVFVDTAGSVVERYEGLTQWHMPENFAILLKKLGLEPEKKPAPQTADVHSPAAGG